MRLTLFSCIPHNLVSSLERIGISTDSDLLFSASTAEILQKLPPNTVSLQDLKEYTAQITERSAVLGVRGDQLLALDDASGDGLDLSSGVYDLDALLNGFGGSRVFEISGEKGSGKTVSPYESEGLLSSICGLQALAMHVTLRCLVNNQHSGALWMDTTGDFSAERVTQLLQSHKGEVGVISRSFRHKDLSNTTNINRGGILGYSYCTTTTASVPCIRH
jgi:RAD51-like protein 3